MKTLLLILITFFLTITVSGQKVDGVYRGLIEMCHTDTLGVKTCFGDELESNDKWFHLSFLKFQNDSVFLDMHPISITNSGDTLFSASDGGFYFYKGISTGTSELRMELVEVNCDYCPSLVKKINDNEYKPIKRELKLTAKIIAEGLLINGYIFSQGNNSRYMESQNNKLDK